MREVNLLDLYPRSTRPLRSREMAKPRQRDVAKEFGKEYFDGDRTQGYGGYGYDGRWVPIANRMKEFYQLKQGDAVLDVGCAKGFLLYDFLNAVPGIRVTGLDISSYALQHAMSSLKGGYIRGNASCLPFAENSFDLVISINTVHNLGLEDCKKAIREMGRVSRRHMYLQVDSWLNEEQRENFERWQLTAATYFDPEGWKNLFRETGFQGEYYWTLTE
jgi:SAM-dependent methyltransferase